MVEDMPRTCLSYWVVLFLSYCSEK